MKRFLLSLMFVFACVQFSFAEDYSGTYVGEQGTVIIEKQNKTYHVTLQSKRIKDCVFSDVASLYKDTTYNKPVMVLHGNDVIFTVEFLEPGKIDASVPMVTDGGQCDIYGEFIKQN